MVKDSSTDSALREAFTRAAEPGESTGVADAIRSRVAAGDTGTSVAGTSAPGFHNSAWSWLPWVGVVALAGLVGGALGAGGVFGRPADTVAVVEYTSALKIQAPTTSCPGGPQVGIMDSGTRVLVQQRSQDSQFLGVRNPADFSSIVWLDAAAIAIDRTQSASALLPVGDPCPVVTVSAAPPAQTPTPTPEPTQPAPVSPKPTLPAPTPDTTRPTIGVPTASKNPITNLESTTISVTASDNKGVTGVLISWLGQYVGSSTMTKSGSNWIFTFTPPTDAAGNITFTMRSTDAAGNVSDPATIIINHQYFG